MKKRIINRLAVEESIQILEDGRQLDIAHACVVVDVLKASRIVLVIRGYVM